MKLLAVIIQLALQLMLLTACSGDLPLFNDMHRGRSDMLERIEITPGDIVLEDKAYSMLIATGYYNDGSSSDLTSKCEWSCDDQKVAVVSAGGYLQARTLSGSANITARYDQLINVAKVTVNIRLVSIEITPASSSLWSTNQIYFTATGITSDGTLIDMTKTVQWSATPFTLAEIDANGLFMARGTSGTVTVTAGSSDGTVISNSASVELNLTTLYVDAAFTESAGDGTKEKPFPTINQAIRRAETIGATRINVAKGTYNEDIIIKSNISLYGGYISYYSGADWTRPATVTPSDTIIIASGNTAVLYMNGLTAATVIDGFQIVGGNSADLSTSTAIMCNNASPTIQNNEIYGGKSSLMSVGILNQTSSPIIRNNPVISGGLADYTGGGADNFAILCQSFSNPIIEGNGSDTTPSQIITGPTGGTSTYRIKCESSSNASIKNNYIETTVTGKVATAKGILAISSSPNIQGNIINSALTTNILIRGENTSFKILSNSINGSIYITSGSMNPVLDNNKIIKGDITVSGASTGVTIRNHIIKDSADANYNSNYGVSTKKIIEGAITYSGSSTGTILNNCLNYIRITGDAFSNIQDNFFFSSDVMYPIAITSGGVARIFRNYIQQISNQVQLIGLYFNNSGNGSTINNNIIYVNNLKIDGSGSNIGIYFDNIASDNIISNNIIFVESLGTKNGIGFYNIDCDTSAIRLYNNVIFIKGNASLYGLYQNSTGLMYAMQANYFINCGSTYAGSHTCADATALNNLDGSGGMFDLNVSLASSAATNLWTDYNSSRTGSDFILNDFHLKSSSLLRNAGKDPEDISIWVATDANYISPDFDSVSRIIPPNTSVVTGSFSIGPYEYVP